VRPLPAALPSPVTAKRRRPEISPVPRRRLRAAKIKNPVESEGVAEVREGRPLRRTPPRKGTGGRGSFELRGWALGGKGNARCSRLQRTNHPAVPKQARGMAHRWRCCEERIPGECVMSDYRGSVHAFICRTGGALRASGEGRKHAYRRSAHPATSPSNRRPLGSAQSGLSAGSRRVSRGNDPSGDGAAPGYA
jgi:hypothetical protein